MFFAFIRPETSRSVLLILLGLGYLGYHCVGWYEKWMRARKLKHEREKALVAAAARVTAAEEQAREAQAEVARVLAQAQASCVEAREVPLVASASVPVASEAVPVASEAVPVASEAVPVASEAVPEISASEPVASAGTQDAELSGEALFAKARMISHCMVPDMLNDKEYLTLLGMAAEKKYAPAMAKLGDYAMRRRAWVEAYYWMYLAKKNGMRKMDAVLHDIRKQWTLDGSPNEAGNFYELFSLEAGSIGRALLNIDTGDHAYEARKYLSKHHPEIFEG